MTAGAAMLPLFRFLRPVVERSIRTNRSLLLYLLLTPVLIPQSWQPGFTQRNRQAQPTHQTERTIGSILEHSTLVIGVDRMRANGQIQPQQRISPHNGSRAHLSLALVKQAPAFDLSSRRPVNRRINRSQQFNTQDGLAPAIQTCPRSTNSLPNYPLIFLEITVGGILIHKGVPMISSGLTGSSASADTPNVVVSPGGYVSPFTSKPSLGRTDQGVDLSLSPGDPIRAIGDAQIVGVIDNWFQGQPFLWYKLLSGPKAGHYVYVAEQFKPSVRIGDTVRAGDVIGTYASSGTSLETGWATSTGQTLARATTGYTEGQVTPAGSSFKSFLQSLLTP